jgi:DNA replication initiation complex subunit (GINS family)
VVVETPTKLSGEERKLLEQLAEIRHEKLKVSAPVPDKSDSASEKGDKNSASGTDHKADNKNSQNGSNSKKKKSQEKDPEPAEAEDKGIFDKIVDVFRPKE